MDDETLIKELEEKLLLQKIRSSREELEKLISLDFIEYGSSGKVYNYLGTIAYLLTNSIDTFSYTFVNFKTRRLSDDVILALYILEIEKNHKINITNRSSLWRREGDFDEDEGDSVWRIIFHQGTRVTK
ncbi:MAG: DUF4440 domain-containing protein [Treponema sp.]|jgi:hypothetical protein|nr:DUF4440 domain-containing protein [Treponema sp.]